MVRLYDVLEHLPDDVAALRSPRVVLAPGGILLVSEPAAPLLWSSFDEVSRQCRRYEQDAIEQKTHHAGNWVEYFANFMAPIYKMLWLSRRVAYLRDRLPGAIYGNAEDLTCPSFA